MSKEKLRLLGDDGHRNPYRKYGPQTGRLVSCGKPHHAHRPEGELCPDCLSWIEAQTEKRKRVEEEARRARTYKPTISIPYPPLQGVPTPVAPKSIGQRYYENRNLSHGGPAWSALRDYQKQIFEDGAAEFIRVCGQTNFDKYHP